MERRRFVSALAAAPFLAWAGSLFAEKALGATTLGRQNAGQYPPSNPNPFPGSEPPASQAPGAEPPAASQGSTAGNTGFPPPVRIDRHAILVQNQKNMRKDVARLYDLAGQLKKQVDKTDSSEVLSLDMLRKAQEIEKLAKHIQSMAKF